VINSTKIKVERLKKLKNKSWELNFFSTFNGYREFDMDYNVPGKNQQKK